MNFHWFNPPAAEAAPDPEEMFALARHRMVAEQLAAPRRGITDPRVLAAMEQVPRHEFVPKHHRRDAYADHPLPIGHGQTISQPFIVAFMTECLDLAPSDRVLEIGAGCGYQAAVLARLAAEVHTVEIVPALARRAAGDLRRLGFANVRVHCGDGFPGWPEAAPFNAIIVTCAPLEVPPPLVAQLAEGGRMILPIGPLSDQRLVLLHKQADGLERHSVMAVRFVPMTGRAGQEPAAAMATGAGANSK